MMQAEKEIRSVISVRRQQQTITCRRQKMRRGGAVERTRKESSKDATRSPIDPSSIVYVRQRNGGEKVLLEKGKV